VWLLGDSRVACVDSTDASAVAAVLDGMGEARAIVTDPPYGVSYRGAAGSIAGDDLRGPALQDLIAGALRSLEPAVAKGTALYMFHGDSQRIATQRACEEAGFAIHASLVWVKNRATLTRTDYRIRHEPILYGWRRGGRRRWYGGRRPTTLVADDLDRLRREASREQLLELINELLGETTVLHEPMPAASPDHPTTKPVPLLARLVANSTQHGDLVLDPFAGSGSTIIAATGTGRRVVGLELEPRFVDVACTRWQHASGAKPVLARTGEPHDFS
jgi:DNA modification methylase